MSSVMLGEALFWVVVHPLVRTVDMLAETYYYYSLEMQDKLSGD